MKDINTEKNDSIASIIWVLLGLIILAKPIIGWFTSGVSWIPLQFGQ